MARQIKETPVLTGENLKRFNRKLKESESKRVSKEEYQDTMNVYRQILANSKLG